MRGKATMPGARCLLQPIQRLVQAAHIIWSGGVDKTSWLSTVDCLRQSAMEKGILHIELMDGP